jgi:hypothetical protein
MAISRRSLSRASALTLAAATFAACGDSTGPLDVTPDQFESIGFAVSTEIEAGVMQLAAQDVMGGVTTPMLSLRSRASGSLLGRSPLGRSPLRLQSMREVDPACGVPSQDPPTDTDGDQIPDNFSITFALPACHFVDPTGYMDLTGLFRVTDPQPGTAGLALNLSVENLRISFGGGEFTGSATRDGSASVTGSGTGLSQTQDWTETVQITGLPRVGVDVNWASTFAAAPGSTITPGQPLPNGAYSPNGTVRYEEGNRAASFSVTTVTALQYSATCAADMETGSALSPFTAGQVIVEFADENRAGQVTISYTGCNEATVQFVAQ